MNSSILIISIGTSLTVVASVIGVISLLGKYRQSSRQLFLSVIINTVVVASMIAVLFTVIYSYDSTKYYLFQLYAITTGVIGSAFIILQLIYQILRRPLLQRELRDLQVNIKEDRVRLDNVRETLKFDPRIADVQILDMSRPLKLLNVYVPLHLNLDTRHPYDIDPTLQEIEANHNPSVLLQAEQRRLDNAVSRAMEPSDAILRFQRCILVGDAGVGKSLLLKFLTLKLLDKQLSDLPKLPIYIDLNEFANSPISDLLDFTASIWAKSYGILKLEAHEYIAKILSEGNAVLLLDGLDATLIGETVDSAEVTYKKVLEAITYLATRFSLSPIIVTSREASYHQRRPLIGFTELGVLNFSWKDIQEFVKNWLKSYEDPQKHNNAGKLLKSIEGNPYIRALASNPLLLFLITQAYELSLDLPRQRAELYKICIETLLLKWDASRDIRRHYEFKRETKIQILEEVAWRFHSQGRYYFPEAELLNVIASFLPVMGLPSEQNEQVLWEIIDGSNLIKQQARHWYSFQELAFQEYFAAKFALDHDRLDTLLTYYEESWWEEVVLLYAASAADASPLLEGLLRQENKLATNLILAGRCLASRPRILQSSLRVTVISRLFETLMNTPDKETKLGIVEVLAEIGGEEVHNRLQILEMDHNLDQYIRDSITKALH